MCHDGHSPRGSLFCADLSDSANKHWDLDAHIFEQTSCPLELRASVSKHLPETNLHRAPKPASLRSPLRPHPNPAPNPALSFKALRRPGTRSWSKRSAGPGRHLSVWRRNTTLETKTRRDTEEEQPIPGFMMLHGSSDFMVFEGPKP